MPCSTHTLRSSSSRAALAAVGFGLGLALVAVSAAVLAIVPAERSGMAASTVNTSRMLGGVLAVAILGAIVNARLVSELTHKLAELGVPHAFRSLIINAVTHGGLPANAAAAAAANPIAAANLGLIAKVLTAADGGVRPRPPCRARRRRRDPARRRADCRGYGKERAIRRTASVSRAPDVAKFSRAKPFPSSPKLGPGESATRPRSRKAALGSSPRPSARQSSHAR